MRSGATRGCRGGERSREGKGREGKIEAVKAEWEKKIAAREVMVKELVEKAKRYQSSLMAMVWSVCLDQRDMERMVCVRWLIGRCLFEWKGKSFQELAVNC